MDKPYYECKYCQKTTYLVFDPDTKDILCEECHSDLVQRCLDNLLREGRIRIVGYHNGEPKYQATTKDNRNTQ